VSHRLRRVAEVLKREIGVLLLREFQFPVPIVTVSAVDITPDLKNAHVFVSAIADRYQREEILEILEHGRITLQTALARRVILKHTPHLHFRFDDSIERGTRVLGILDELGLDDDPQ
jgi:ribosome-binding factor A